LKGGNLSQVSAFLVGLLVGLPPNELLNIAGWVTHRN
ncbi:hypothetical protein MNBD_NITROSPINAE01-816, partial [hydrothermal vent metagenome]